jgi:hypothetical protein
VDEETFDEPPRSLPVAPLAALGGGLAIGLASLMIPNHLLENTVTAYGIAELLPAAAPPLGVTARVLIALGSGLFTASCLYIFFSYKGPSKMAFAISRPSQPGKGGLFNLLRSLRFGKNAARDGEIADFDELPKLRMGDSHPDAPARRPIFAGKDLGTPLTLGLNDELADDVDYTDDDADELVRDTVEHSGTAAATDEPPVEAYGDTGFDGDFDSDDMEAETTGDAGFLTAHGAYSDAEPSIENDLGKAGQATAFDESVSSFDNPRTGEAEAIDASISEMAFRAPNAIDDAAPADKPITELSITELMERLERGLQNRLHMARDDYSNGEAAARAADPASDADDADGADDANTGHRNQSFDNVHAFSASADEAAARQAGTSGLGDEPVQVEQRDDRLDMAKAQAIVPVANVAHEVPENELDDALKTALKTLRIMTERQKNSV